jgi:hypothetical protein
VERLVAMLTGMGPDPILVHPILKQYSEVSVLDANGVADAIEDGNSSVAVRCEIVQFLQKCP